MVLCSSIAVPRCPTVFEKHVRKFGHGSESAVAHRQRRTGTVCDYGANQGEGTLGACQNKATSLENKRYSGTYGNSDMYYSLSSYSACVCIGWGTYWSDLRNKNFNWGGSDGKNQAPDNNIYRWAFHTGSCG